MHSWKEKRERLATLIKELSAKAGGDDDEFLNEYIAELLAKYSNDLDTAIACFEDLIRQYE